MTFVPTIAEDFSFLHIGNGFLTEFTMSPEFTNSAKKTSYDQVEDENTRLGRFKYLFESVLKRLYVRK